MRPHRRIPALVCAVLVAAACGGPPVVLRTAPSPAPGVDQACMDALATGVLARHPITGYGIAEPGGPVMGVTWPPGWSAGYRDGAAAVFDEAGGLIATEGGPISIGGGMIDGETWLACG
jgi:hypothetical protein